MDRAPTFAKVMVDGVTVRATKAPLPEGFNKTMIGTSSNVYPVELEGELCGFLLYRPGGGFSHTRRYAGWHLIALACAPGHFGKASLFNPVPNVAAPKRLIEWGSACHWTKEVALQQVPKLREKGALPTLAELPAWIEARDQRLRDLQAKLDETEAALKAKRTAAIEAAEARAKAAQDAAEALRKETLEGLTSILERQQGLGLTNFETEALMRAIKHYGGKIDGEA